MLEKLVFHCQTFESGALDTGRQVPAESSVPHRLCILHMIGQLWSILDVGTTVALAYEGNPTKVQGEKALVPRLAHTTTGVWRKKYPSTKINCQWELMYQKFWQIWGWKKIPLKW